MDLMRGILEICLRLDEIAVESYAKFAESCPEGVLGREWGVLAREEKAHVRFWEKLIGLHDSGGLPDVLDNRADVHARLEKTLTKVRSAVSRLDDYSDCGKTFSAAYMMESFMLDACFLQFFDYFGSEYAGARNYDRHVERFIRMLTDHGGRCDGFEHLEAMGSNLYGLYKQNRELVRRSLTDPLTGLYNRRGFELMTRPLLGLASRDDIPFGVIICDLDRFKSVNDTYGHGRGDEVLRAASEAIGSAVRKSDVVGRHGGEEFMVFLLLKDLARLEVICARINRAVKSSTGKKAGVKVSVSLGGAWFQGGEKDCVLSAGLIDEADRNLMDAKASGRDCWRISRFKG